MVAAQSVRNEARRVRPVRLCAPEVIVDRGAEGTIHLRSPHALPDYPDKLTERLVHWAHEAPDRVFMAERPPPHPSPQAGEGKGPSPAGEGRGAGWRTIPYAQTLARVRRIGAALLKRDLSPERPIAILSGND